jgi:hypothetical protein
MGVRYCGGCVTQGNGTLLTTYLEKYEKLHF